MHGRKTNFFFQALKIASIFFCGYALALLAGATEEKALLVGFIAFCGYMFGHADADR